MKPKSYQNFEIALKKLQEFVKQGVKDDLDMAGLIQGFEFTFEQAWKAVQKKAGEESLSLNSPKQAFSWAMEMNWISRTDENMWLRILDDRNQTTHTYKEDLAKTVSEKIAKEYVGAFSSLLENMKKAE